MGFKDAMRTNVEGLARRSMEAGARGQAKMESMQAKRRGDGLLHDLGAAFYIEQRLDGDARTTRTLLAALDQHAAEHGLDTSRDVAGPGSGAAVPLHPPAPPRPEDTV
jgi:hypothetical protein